MQKLKSHAQAEPEPLESLRDDVPAELVGRRLKNDGEGSRRAISNAGGSRRGIEVVFPISRATENRESR